MDLFKYLLPIIGIIINLNEILPHQIYDKFGTTTAYRFVANYDLKVGPFPGCEQKKIWMMARHGTRNPTANVMRAMKTYLPDIRDSIIKSHYNGKGDLSATEISLFEKWQLQNVNTDYEKMLTIEGEDELLSLGKRYRERFNQIIPQKFDNKSIKFRFTATERAKKSANFFARGLFGTNKDYVIYYGAPEKKDPLLRFYKTCDSWQMKVKRNPNTYTQLNLYMIGNEIIETMANISLKFGMSDLTSDNGKLIYQACAFETAWTKNFTSPWCSAFTKHNIQPFEYADDLSHYWLNGYSYPINQRLACNIPKDLMHFFSDIRGPLSAFHFTHSGAMLKTLVHFGLYKPDANLMHDSRDPNRPWRTSLMDAFGSNLAFILYNCGVGGEKILTMHQEKPVHMPGCGADEDFLCDIDSFFKPLTERMENCDLDELCWMPSERNEL